MMMKWHEIYSADHIPSIDEIGAYIGESKKLWDDLISYIEEAYRVKPQITYSTCSMQPGWNVKYKKSGRSLCTLYPMDGSFIALVVIGSKEEDEVKMGMDAGLFTSYVKELFEKTPYSAMGRWLMIHVRDSHIEDDIKRLMRIKVRPK